MVARYPSAQIMKFKGTNAICPCRFCKMKAIPHVKGNKTTYYLTTVKEKDKNNLNYRNLPRRTHVEIASQAVEIEGTSQPQLKKTRQMSSGINGRVGKCGRELFFTDIKSSCLPSRAYSP